MSLSDEQTELLVKAKQKGGPENVEIISSDAAETVREALGSALQKRHGLPEQSVEAMNWESLAAPFVQDVSEEADSDDLTDVLAQRPEVGGTDAAEIAEQNQQADDEPEGFEALTSEQQADVRDKLERAETFGSRLPKHAENLRTEAAEMVPGVESADEIELD